MSEIWNTVWKNRRVTSDYSLQYYNFINSFSKRLEKNGKVLEAGCGSGDTLKCFKNQKSFGLDLSTKSLELAKGNANNLVLADLFKMPFKDGSFDLVYNSGVLEHFLEEKTIEGVKEMARVTKQGGYVIIIMPNTLCIWFRIYKYLTIKITGKWEFGYEESYSIIRLKRIIKKSKLKVIKKFGLQVLLPLATNRFEILPLKFRKYLIYLDKLFLFREYYAFGIGVICKKK